MVTQSDTHHHVGFCSFFFLSCPEEWWQDSWRVRVSKEFRALPSVPLHWVQLLWRHSSLWWVGALCCALQNKVSAYLFIFIFFVWNAFKKENKRLRRKQNVHSYAWKPQMWQFGFLISPIGPMWRFDSESTTSGRWTGRRSTSCRPSLSATRAMTHARKTPTSCWSNWADQRRWTPTCDLRYFRTRVPAMGQCARCLVGGVFVPAMKAVSQTLVTWRYSSKEQVNVKCVFFFWGGGGWF